MCSLPSQSAGMTPHLESSNRCEERCIQSLHFYLFTKTLKNMCFVYVQLMFYLLHFMCWLIMSLPCFQLSVCEKGLPRGLKAFFFICFFLFLPSFTFIGVNPKLMFRVGPWRLIQVAPELFNSFNKHNEKHIIEA